MSDVSQDWRFRFVDTATLPYEHGEPALDGERLLRALQKIATLLNVDGKRIDWVEEAVQAVEDRIHYTAAISRRRSDTEPFHIFPIESVRSLCGTVRRDDTWKSWAEGFSASHPPIHCDVCLNADSAHMRRKQQ